MDNELKCLILEYENVCNISTKPKNIKKLKSTHIEDENKSVKWNRDFIEENNKKYLEGVAQLQRQRSMKINESQNEIEEYIKKLTGVSKKAAREIFNFAYSEGHSMGINNVGIWIEKLCKLFLRCKEK